MATGGYKNLSFQPHVNWAEVAPRLLQALDEVGEELGVVIDVFSGYRTPAYSAAVGGYANDAHTRGVAVDANIAGVGIGAYPGAARLLEARGLEHGNTPNFYKGRPDPSHVHARNSGVDKSINSGNWGGGTAAPGTAGATSGAGIPSGGLQLGGPATSGGGCLPQVISGVAILTSIMYVLFS